jgi:peptide/nickel transport system ATP-binding protein
MTGQPHLLLASHLQVVGEKDVPIAEDVSLSIDEGELAGLVGESGSGKTTLALACLGFAKAGTRITAGEVSFAGQDLRHSSPQVLRSLRRRDIAYVPQSSGYALNPALRLDVQLGQRLADVDRPRRQAMIEGALDEVALPIDRSFLKRYPHELSGGQQQRVLIAGAFITHPRLVVLDEPTTGLDVSTQAHILELVRRMCDAHGTAALFISHDLGAVAEVCSSITVMYAGRVVEAGATDKVLGEPRHPYTHGLIAAVPDITARRPLLGIGGHAPSREARSCGCTFAPRCFKVHPICQTTEPSLVPDPSDRLVRCHFPLEAGDIERRLAVDRVQPADRAAWPDLEPADLKVRSLSVRYGNKEVLHDADFEVAPASCLAVVGESGSGKTTLCRAIIGLNPNYAGEITVDGDVIPARSVKRSATLRRSVQYIFQSPYDALNPRLTVAEIIAMPAELFGLKKKRERRNLVAEMLAAVSLESSVASKYPEQLSGGERQRVAIARALAAQPRIILCDEVTSSLDVSVQASIVNLLEKLRRELDVTLVFVTHNIALVPHIADRVAVFRNGNILELGPTKTVFEHPSSDYTRSLIEDSPDLWRMLDGWKRARSKSGDQEVSLDA